MEVAGGVGHPGVALVAGGVALVPVDLVHAGAVCQPDAQLLVAAEGEAGPAVAVYFDLQVPATSSNTFQFVEMIDERSPKSQYPISPPPREPCQRNLESSSTRDVTFF